VLLVTILTIVVSLSAVVYAAALTNPGHGVEEIGSGSSPYAPFRDWNVLEAGYEDQYSGPSGFKANVFWLATTNAQTLAAQNSSEDWCALQVHPSGIYMNCFNNASNMTLYNSYYWNGTNFTKNDTIKKDDDWVEKEIIQAGANGGDKSLAFQNPGTGDKFEEESSPTGSTSNIFDGGAGLTVGSFEISNTATGAKTTITSTPDAGVGGSTVTVNEDEIKNEADDGAGNTGTSTLTPNGKTDTVDDGTGNVGKFELGNDIVDLTVEDTGTEVVGFMQGTDANGGTSNLDIFNLIGTLQYSKEVEVGGDGGCATTLIYDNAGLLVVDSTKNADENGGLIEQELTDIGTGGTSFLSTSGSDGNGNGFFEFIAQENVGGLNAQTSITTGFDAAGDGLLTMQSQDNTGTATASIALDSDGGAAGNGAATINAPTIQNENTFGAGATTYTITAYDSEIAWSSGVVANCPGPVDFIVVVSQAVDGETIDGISVNPVGTFTITTTPGGVGTGFARCFAVNNY